MYGYIYKTTDLTTGKIYIGQHKHTEFDTNYIGSGKKLREAIFKYGVENFKCEMLDVCDSKEELDNKEIYYIDKYNSTNPDIGYNITTGGYSLRDYKFTDEDRYRISIASTRNNLNRDRIVYDNLSAHHKGARFMNNGFEQTWAYGTEIEDLLNQGWVFGSCKKRNRDYSGKNNTMYGKSAVKGKIWVHTYKDNKLIRKYVLPHELDLYISQGWSKGMK